MAINPNLVDDDFDVETALRQYKNVVCKIGRASCRERVSA